MEVDLGNNINDDDNTSLKSFKSHEDDFDDQNALFSIGNVVVVFPRTWPGINKLGGVGRILKVYRNEGLHMDLLYLIYLLYVDLLRW
jgi:hypothetical protein